MVICPADPGLQADIIFMIEATAVNGAYINDLKTNYVLPALEYFSQGVIDDTNFVSDNANSLYGIVLYQAADCLPHLCSDTLGPFSSPGKVISAIDKLELCGGKGESHANIAEGLATSLACFEELQQKRDPAATVQKHCILICNSPPYTMPVLESQAYSGKNAEQLAVILQEKNINLSVISPRKIPSLYKLFEKAGGDLTASLTKNYAKDPRHLVLLKGFSLKERPVSPPPGNNVASQSINNASIPMTSLPSPLPGCDSPSQSTNLLGQSNPSGVQQGQSPVYRPPSTGMGQIPQHVQQSMVSPNMGGMPQRQNMMGNNQMPNMAPNMAPNMQQINAPPGYHAPNTLGAQRPQARWMMPPQQRPYMQPNQPNNPNQGSALIAQLSQPPSSVTNPQVNPYAQMNTNSTLQQQQQPPMKMNMSQHLQSSNPPNQSTQQQSMSQSQPGQVVTSQAQGANTPVSRPTIWQGLLEWIEKPKNATDQNKITKHVPCQVSANTKDGEPELKADGWPSKLIMQLMPKQLIGNIGGAYLKNSKSVLFHPQNCEALESLTKVMSSGFAGCVHFTSITNPAGCDIKVLILLYTAEKRAYLGFIPNDQGAFVDRLRKVIQQQKSSQQIMRSNQLPDASQIGLLQGNAGPSMNPQGGSLTMGGTPPQMGNNPVSSQPQQGLMMSQTNTMTMGGGQITQNVVSSTNQGAPGMAGVMGQNPGGGMQPRMRMPGIQQGMGGPQQGMGGPQQGMGGPQPNQQGMPGMMPPTGQVRENQLQAERQHNLDKINQMKQALEAAQQQEQQYKSQLERINHMKTNQLQEALQIAQQTEMQYKMMDQQRMNQSQQAANAQQQGQQRMMRPVMSNNPGLRHLLQQQPQYRQQVIGIQQMGGNPPRPQQMGQQMPNPGSNQSTFDDVSSFDFM